MTQRARDDRSGSDRVKSTVDAETVDIDAMGDLDMGANDANDAEPSTGSGSDYGGLNAGRDPVVPGTATDTTSAERFRPDTGSGQGPASAMRVTAMPGGMGSGVGDDDGSGPGMDTDPGTIRGGSLSTGTPQRSGLGGPSSGREMDDFATGDASVLNQVDTGDQG
jgi:hypothetical protein